MLVGVDPAVRDQLAKTGVLKLIGDENVFLATPQIGAALNQAVAAANAWLAPSSAGAAPHPVPVRRGIACRYWPTRGHSRMSDQPAGSSSGRFEVRVTAESHFAWLRTRLAVERTMMAYLRTAVSLIGFGFAHRPVLPQLPQHARRSHARFPDAAWYMGLALIFCGVLAAVSRCGSTGGHCVTCGAAASRRSRA